MHARRVSASACQTDTSVFHHQTTVEKDGTTTFWGKGSNTIGAAYMAVREEFSAMTLGERRELLEKMMSRIDRTERKQDPTMLKEAQDEFAKCIAISKEGESDTDSAQGERSEDEGEYYASEVEKTPPRTEERKKPEKQKKEKVVGSSRESVGRAEERKSGKKRKPESSDEDDDEESEAVREKTARKAAKKAAAAKRAALLHDGEEETEMGVWGKGIVQLSTEHTKKRKAAADQEKSKKKKKKSSRELVDLRSDEDGDYEMAAFASRKKKSSHSGASSSKSRVG